MADKPITLTPLTKPLRLHFSGKRVTLPADLQSKVDAYWQTRLAENPHLFNGETFTLTSFTETPTEIRGELDESDFAHSLYSYQAEMDEYAYRVIHSACLVITSDNKLVVGEMHKNTARAGIICCSGGGIDRGDLRGGNVIDLDYSTEHELNEEFGVDPHDEHALSFGPAFIKSGGPGDKITVLYVLKTSLSSQQFADNYTHFTEQLAQDGKAIEYERLFYVDNTPTAIEDFIAEHTEQLDAYIPALFRAVSSK